MFIPLKKQYPNRHGLPVIEKVDQDIFIKCFPKDSCLEIGCHDICCSGGATMDLTTFLALLSYKTEFPSIDWTGYQFEPDRYSPGGQGCYTRFPDNRCMFQNQHTRGCSLHTFCLERGIDYRTLKFFTCCLFPCEVNRIGEIGNILTVGYELRFQDQFQLPCGRLTGEPVYQLCRENIGYYYGAELLGELDLLQTAICKERQAAAT